MSENYRISNTLEYVAEHVWHKRHRNRLRNLFLFRMS
jgi:hypothetical protein